MTLILQTHFWIVLRYAGQFCFSWNCACADERWVISFAWVAHKNSKVLQCMSTVTSQCQYGFNFVAVIFIQSSRLNARKSIRHSAVVSIFVFVRRMTLTYRNRIYYQLVTWKEGLQPSAVSKHPMDAEKWRLEFVERKASIFHCPLMLTAWKGRKVMVSVDDARQHGKDMLYVGNLWKQNNLFLRDNLLRGRRWEHPARPWITHFSFSAAFHQLYSLYPWSQPASLPIRENIASRTLSRNTVPDTRSSRTDRACAGKQSQMLLLRYKYLGPWASFYLAIRPILQPMGKDYSLIAFGTNSKVCRLSHFPI